LFAGGFGGFGDDFADIDITGGYFFAFIDNAT